MPMTSEEHERLNEEIKARKAEQELYHWDEELLDVFTRLLARWKDPGKATSICRTDGSDIMRFYASGAIETKARYRVDSFGERAKEIWDRFREQAEAHITQYMLETLQDYVDEVTALRDADLYVAAGETPPPELAERAPRRIKLREEESEAAEAAS